METTFIKELESVINRHSKDNDANIPDFILADYMNDCLDALSKAMRRLEHWKTH